MDLAAISLGLAGLVTAIAGLIKVLYEVRKVHTIVNSQRTEMMERIDKLNELLAESRTREKDFMGPPEP